MADISKIKLPNNNQYDLKDAYARGRISKHIMISSTQPAATDQVSGDIWIVLVEEQEEQ